MPRLFVAIDLPDQIKNTLSQLSDFGLSGVKWIEKEQFHLSLRFIGETDPTLSQDIVTALSKIKSPPFSLSLKGLGTFPQKKDPRVLWVGINKSEQLIRLQKKIEHQLNHLGLERERRKFSPHITLGRVKKPNPRKISSFLEHNALYSSAVFEIDRFFLYSSQLTPKGAIYHKNEGYELL